MFNVNNRKSRTRREIYSKLTITKPERRQWQCQWRRSGVFMVNFEHISYLALVFLLLTLCIYVGMREREEQRCVQNPVKQVEWSILQKIVYKN